MQLRAGWTHQGGSWGVPGGARDSHEDDEAAALREAHEEAAVLPAQIVVAGGLPGVEHSVWAYRYVLAVVTAGALGVEDPGDELRPRTTESARLRWVPLAAVDALPLHEGLRAAWPALRAEAGRLIDNAARPI
jgi:8-oxo-dGTP diphosphatase